MQNKNDLTIAHEQEKYLLDTFPLIKRIAQRKLNLSSARDSIEDIVQTVVMRLWKWKAARGGYYLTEDEWQRLANTVTQNEVSRLHAAESESRRLHLQNTQSSNGETFNFIEILSSTKQPFLEGNTNAEARSLIFHLWKGFTEFSVKERYSLFLCRSDLIDHLIGYKCCTITELAVYLNLTREEFLVLMDKLPLSDKDIASLLSIRLAESITVDNVRKTRQRVKLRLYKLLAEVDESERSFVPRTTEDVSGRTFEGL